MQTQTGIVIRCSIRIKVVPLNREEKENEQTNEQRKKETKKEKQINKLASN